MKGRSILPVLLLLSAVARAGAENGLTAAPVLNRPVGARSSAMGRAFTAVSGDPECLMYNPAGLSSVSGIKPYAAYMNGFAGGYGLLAVPLSLRGFVLTPAFLYYNSGSMALNLSDGTSGSVTAELDKVAMISAAYSPLPGAALGATLKRTSVDLAETVSASALNFDLGAQYSPLSGLTLGAAALNSGQGMKFEEKEDPAPRTLRAGAAYRLVPEDPNFLDHSSDLKRTELLFAADYSRTYREKGYIQTGMEIAMTMSSVLLSLRGGYLFGRDEDGAAFGFGIKSGRWDLNFGFETGKKLDSRRPVSMSYKF